MKFLAVLLTCLLAASLLVVFVAGEEVAEEAASSSSESVSSSSEEAIAESSSGSEEIESEASGVSGVGSGTASGEEPASGEHAEASEEDEAPQLAESPKREITSLSDYEINEIVTMRIGSIDGSQAMSMTHMGLIRQSRSRIFDELCEITHDCDLQYDMNVILPTPRLIDGELEVSIFIESVHGPVDGQTLLGAIRNIEPTISSQIGLQLRSVYIGVPADIEQMRVSSAARTGAASSQDAFKLKSGLFVTIVGIAGAGFIVLAVGFFVLRSKTRADDKLVVINLEQGQDSPSFEINSPISDEEIQLNENSSL